MLLKPSAPPPRVIGVRVWPKAIPQFNIGHLDSVAAAKAGLADAGWDGLLLSGNYVAGGLMAVWLPGMGGGVWDWGERGEERDWGWFSAVTGVVFCFAGRALMDTFFNWRLCRACTPAFTGICFDGAGADDPRLIGRREVARPWFVVKGRASSDEQRSTMIMRAAVLVSVFL